MKGGLRSEWASWASAVKLTLNKINLTSSESLLNTNRARKVSHFLVLISHPPEMTPALWIMPHTLFSFISGYSFIYFFNFPFLLLFASIFFGGAVGGRLGGMGGVLYAQMYGSVYSEMTRNAFCTTNTNIY